MNWMSKVIFGMVVVHVMATWVAIFCQLTSKDDLIKLADMLLSWKVISAGLGIGAGSTYYDAIVKKLN